MDIQLKKGLLDVCVLAAVGREPSYGYQIVRIIKPFVEISESTLYPILRRLEAADCLRTYSREHNGRLRKYYAITPAGQARLDSFRDDWEQIRTIYAFIRLYGGFDRKTESEKNQS